MLRVTSSFNRLRDQQRAVGHALRVSRQRLPRVLARAHTTQPDPLHEMRVQWAQERQHAMQFDTGTRDTDPHETDTTLAPPWRTVLVPECKLQALSHHHYPVASGIGRMWNVGMGRPVSNCNPFDINPGAIDFERLTSRPGCGPGTGKFRNIVRGAYGNRDFKYLWALDHRGMHIAREMTPCKFSARGIITHSILVDQGIVGGEIFFDTDDDGKVFVNFGSSRLPFEDARQAEKVVEFVLALGYHTVVAMIPDRDLNEFPYSMRDRYGQRVENMVFRRDL